MLVPISEINVNSGRRKVETKDVDDLAKSISEVGLLNPITITADRTLIAGRHRLEAAKLLGWTEIECTVNDLNGLRAELAEIDENFVRINLSAIEFGDLLLRRKNIYEKLHPETKATKEGGPFRGNQHDNVVTENFSATSKSFVDDTAEKLRVTPRTVRNQLQTARNLTPEAKDIIRSCVGEVNFWTEAMVLKIVRDEQYTGSTVYGRRYYDRIGQSHSVKVSKKDWIVVPDVHEPIVSREEFDRAQAALKEYKERDVSAGTKTKIRCGVCGHAMERHNTKQPYYDCRTLRVTDRFPCPSEKILEQEIQAALLDSLRSMAQMAVDMDKLLREQQKEKVQDVVTMRRSFYALQEQLSQLKQQTKSQYEAFVLGEIGKEEYLAVKTKSRQKEKILSEQISKLELSMEQAQLADSNENGLAARLRPYLDVEQLTKDILDNLLAQVLVFPDGRLEIRWKFQDELERLREMALR